MVDSPDREVAIYLPPNYDKANQRYPVLYLLHGYTGNDRGWMDPTYVGLPEMMDRLIEHHTIVPMIVVMPNSFNRFAAASTSTPSCQAIGKTSLCATW